MDSYVENVKIIGDVLTEKELHYIVMQAVEPGYEIIDYHLRPASEEGIKGFVGDHFRMTVSVKDKDEVRKIYLFIKTLPIINIPKSDFIVQNQFFKREALMFELLEEMQETDCPNTWHSKAFIHNEHILVMPDLSVQGYKIYPVQNYFDKNHVLTTVSALAQFHAAFTKYTTKKIREDRAYSFLDKHRDVMAEPTLCDCAWLRAAAKLTNNFLREFSSVLQQCPGDLEKELLTLFIRGCESLKEYTDTVNVIVHKDLWANNILFRYNGDVATCAVLLDFQCIRYAPPAFDLMLLLYLTTSRDFRDRYENEILQKYYSIFSGNLDDHTEKRLHDLKYDQDAFLVWCERARLLGMVLAIAIFPFILMDPNVAQKTFDDPETYMEYLEEDRSIPVIGHARDNVQYRNRQLELCEELVERYVTKYNAYSI